MENASASHQVVCRYALHIQLKTAALNPSITSSITTPEPGERGLGAVLKSYPTNTRKKSGSISSVEIHRAEFFLSHRASLSYAWF
jgi:hypothetical protein